MKALFCNAPWWGEQNWQEFKDWNTGELKREYRYYQGVRAGSRWPYLYLGQSSPDNFVYKDYIPFPYFMAYAASYAKRHTSCKIILRDSIARKESYESYLSYLKKELFDYIFFESSTPSFEHDKTLIKKIRKISPKSKIIITGPVSVRGEEIIKELDIYAVIKGEYEKGSVKVLKGESGVIEYDLLSEEEMNNAPFPLFEKDVLYNYYNNRPLGQIFPHAHVWASRGCPFKCIFCVWPATMSGDDPDGTKIRKVRYYNKEYMEKYVDYLVNDLKFKSLWFDDDTFNLGDRHTKEMCEVLAKYDIAWSAMCRADTIKMETWDIMKKSGCFGVSLGFESGSQFVVDKIVNKHLDLKYAKKVIKHIKNLGMSIHGSFTFGLPGESYEQMRMTMRFIEEAEFDSYQTSGCAEMDGTPLSTLSQKGELKNFEEAKIDENYNRETDGNRKWQRVVEQLQES